MVQMVKLILLSAIFVFFFIFSKGLFYVYKAESKNCYWKAYPKKKPKKFTKDEKQRRFIVSLESSLVMISTFDFEKGEFDVEGVDAFREVPQCYKWVQKQIRFYKERRNK